jgi:pimeloyl-ACP methyl ester carboxylesterase
VSHIVKEIERRNLHDVVLVGHSWGGAPITAVAHRIPERVAKVIYYSAFVPQRGFSMNDENLPENAAYVRAAIEASPNGTVGLSFDLFQQFFMQGVPEAAQRLAFDLLLPHPGGYMLDALDVDGDRPRHTGGLRARRTGPGPGPARCGVRRADRCHSDHGSRYARVVADAPRGTGRGSARRLTSAAPTGAAP